MTAKLPRCVTRRIAYLDLEIETLLQTIQSLKGRLNRAQEHQHVHGDQAAGEEIALIQAKRVQATGRLDEVKRLRGAIDQWLSRAAYHNIKLQEADRKFGPKLSIDDNALKERIDKARGEIAQLKAEMFDVRRAPVAIPDLKKQVSAYVYALAKEGGPKAVSADNGKLKIEFTSMSGATISPHKYLAWLDPQRMIDRLVQEFEERQALNGRKAMSAGEKETELEEMEAALEKLERREIAMVDMALDRELRGVQHRTDVNIAAFLGIEQVKRLTAKAA